MKENWCTSYPLKFDDLTVDSGKPTSATVCTCPSPQCTTPGTHNTGTLQYDVDNHCIVANTLSLAQLCSKVTTNLQMYIIIWYFKNQVYLVYSSSTS